MLHTSSKKAFTMIELIFVMIILGIVASIGSSIIAQVYESYVVQRAVHRASIKTELAINQLANRLAYRIDQSMLARISINTGYNTPTDVYPVSAVPMGSLDTYNSLEWISYDNDGFSATNPPAWSAFADLEASNFNTLKSIGSDFAKENTILDSLAGGGGHQNPAIIFRGTTDYRYDAATTTVYGYDTLAMYRANGSIFPVTLLGDTLTFAGGDRVANQMIYTEFYQLAASAYAVVPENLQAIDGVNVWDLKFYYNYQPWLGTPANGIASATSSTLIENVSVFRFKQEPNSLRIKICIIERTSFGSHISICKEKAVIR